MVCGTELSECECISGTMSISDCKFVADCTLTKGVSLSNILISESIELTFDGGDSTVSGVQVYGTLYVAQQSQVTFVGETEVANFGNTTIQGITKFNKANVYNFGYINVQYPGSIIHEGLFINYETLNVTGSISTFMNFTNAGMLNIMGETGEYNSYGFIDNTGTIQNHALTTLHGYVKNSGKFWNGEGASLYDTDGNLNFLNYGALENEGVMKMEGKNSIIDNISGKIENLVTGSFVLGGIISMKSGSLTNYGYLQSVGKISGCCELLCENVYPGTWDCCDAPCEGVRCIDGIDGSSCMDCEDYRTGEESGCICSNSFPCSS